MSPGFVEVATDSDDRDQIIAYWRRPENRAEAERLGFVQPELTRASPLRRAPLRPVDPS